MASRKLWNRGERVIGAIGSSDRASGQTPISPWHRDRSPWTAPPKPRVARRRAIVDSFGGGRVRVGARRRVWSARPGRAAAAAPGRRARRGPGRLDRSHDPARRELRQGDLPSVAARGRQDRARDRRARAGIERRRPIDGQRSRVAGVRDTAESRARRLPDHRQAARPGLSRGLRQRRARRGPGPRGRAVTTRDQDVASGARRRADHAVGHVGRR